MLLIPAIHAQQAYYRQLGLRDAPRGLAREGSHIELAADGGSSVDSLMAAISGCTRVNGSIPLLQKYAMPVSIEELN